MSSWYEKNTIKKTKYDQKKSPFILNSNLIQWWSKTKAIRKNHLWFGSDQKKRMDFMRVKRSSEPHFWCLDPWITHIGVTISFEVDTILDISARILYVLTTTPYSNGIRAVRLFYLHNIFSQKFAVKNVSFQVSKIIFTKDSNRYLKKRLVL